MILRLALRLALLISLSLSASVAAAAPQLRNVLAPHRAVYEIKLARTNDGSGVSSADGKMVFEVTGNICDGYKMRQRMVVNIGDEDGNFGMLDFRITTFESGDGNVYSFDSRTTMNQEVVEAVAGEARRKGENIEVSLKEPAEKKVTLDGGVLFPSQHLQAILDAAREKRRFLAVNIYEGAGTGETTDEAAAAIGGAMPLATDAPLRSGVRHWPVSVGYFDPVKHATTVFGEELPTYQMSFTLYENGVTNDLVMDYGDYALSGSLKTIEPLASEDCASR